jgi:hypothetical protein
MENKHDSIFDGVIAACQAKHLREILAFKKDWNNELIAQFYATVYFEEHGDTRKIHWMTESQCMKCHIPSLLDFLDLSIKKLAAQEFT